jgi:hypothetical protein
MPNINQQSLVSVTKDLTVTRKTNPHCWFSSKTIKKKTVIQNERSRRNGTQSEKDQTQRERRKDKKERKKERNRRRKKSNQHLRLSHTTFRTNFRLLDSKAPPLGIKRPPLAIACISKHKSSQVKRSSGFALIDIIQTLIVVLQKNDQTDRDIWEYQQQTKTSLRDL